MKQVGRSDMPLFATLASAAGRQVGHLSMHKLANAAWSFATAHRSGASLFEALNRAA